MGLDITCYSKLRPENPPLSDDSDAYELIDEIYEQGLQYYMPTALAWSDQAFPNRCPEFKSDQWYAYDASYSFRAGSYGGYNVFREGLAVLAGVVSEEMWREGRRGAEGMYDLPAVKALESDPTSRPFGELIMFADNEGVIGTACAKRLFADFINHREAAKALFNEEGMRWMDAYDHWIEGLRHATDGGAIDFH